MPRILVLPRPRLDLLWSVAGSLLIALSASADTLFTEDFDSLAPELGPFQSDTESGGDGTDWTATLPADWFHDTSGVPSGGVTEFSGWTFLDPVSWNATAGQARDQFTKGQSVVAVADGDEWDDSGPAGRMQSILSTPAIPLTDVPENSVLLKFDSSWRTEPQFGWVRVSFDGGEAMELLALTSETPDELNRTYALPIANPAGAASMVISFDYEAGNNWWWAIDNLEVVFNEPIITQQPVGGEFNIGDSGALTVEAVGVGDVTYQWYVGQGADRTAIDGATGPELAVASLTTANTGLYSVDVTSGGVATSDVVGISVIDPAAESLLLSENFDSLTLESFVSDTEKDDTGAFYGDGTDWTATPPETFDVDQSLVPEGGVPEFAGWTFLDPVSWNETAGQDRGQFAKGMNVVAVADGDEWDDSGPEGRMTTLLSTKPISLIGIGADAAVLMFDSSWRTEPQTGLVKVAYDGGESIELLRFDSDSPDALNDTIVLPLNNPGGASSVVISFEYEAGNNWWWAIDNVVVTGNQVVIAEQPVGGDFEPGAEVALTVDAVGGILSYQWYQGAGPERSAIDGATGPTLLFGSLLDVDSGVYSVDVTNTAGNTVTSAEATLNVAAPANILFSETFDSLPLSPFESETESGGDGTDWTAAAPAGWVVDNSQVPEGGVAEFAGWTFLDPVSWNASAGQNRDQFTKGRNVVAVGDGDEWDDSSPGARMFTKLTTPAISLTGIPADSVKLAFDSSWRTEPQTGTVEISFDGGETTTLLTLTSESPDALNETIELDIDNPAGASSLTVSFTYEAGNNWWWAIDNVVVSYVDSPVIFEENFDSVELTAFTSDSESGGDGTDWSATPPEGWVQNNDGVPAGGVDEFAGWTFLDPVSWNASAGQARDQFAKGRNVVAVADGDEWDDSSPGARMETFLTTPDIALAGIGADTVTLQFDSSWRTEPQTGVVSVSFDGGELTQLLLYTSETPDALNETVLLPINNPEGATSMAITFGYEAGNNWWWAIDNIKVTGNAPVILAQPEGVEAQAGEIIGLTVEAQAGRVYQWFKDGTAIEGATEATLALGGAIVSDNGTYTVDVSNGAGMTVTSDPVTVAVTDPFADGEIFSETFDSLELGPFVSGTESGGDGTDWTATAPSGWTVDLAGVPAGGVPEFAGWTFLDPNSWDATAQQNRGLFTKGRNVIAVGDGDEWDDSSPGARMLTSLISPPIDISGKPASSVALKVDSSWRTEPQTGMVQVAFDGGDPVTLVELTSASPDALNDTLFVPIDNPAGASSMTVSFTYEAGNNWWWAIDNVQVLAETVIIVDQPVGGTTLTEASFDLSVSGHGGDLSYQWFKDEVALAGATSATLSLNPVVLSDGGTYFVEISNTAGSTLRSEPVSLDVEDNSPTVVVFSENFDSLPLGDVIDEQQVDEPFVWTDTPPEGWVVDDSGVPGFDSEDADGDGRPDLDGVTEWAGWSFAEPRWWALAAGDQQRTSFTRACGAVMIADPDEWDDAAHTPFGENDGYDAFITTPDISLDGVTTGSLKMRFDSSWRPEADNDVPGGNNQTAVIRVSYDDGDMVELLRWESAGDSPNFKGDATNEVVIVQLNNPEGAQNAKIEFGLVDAGNDWWWAVDNLLVYSGLEPPAILTPPLSQQVFSNSPAELSVGVDTENTLGDVTYQWYKRVEGGERVAIDGATSDTLSLESAQVEDTGFYSVDVSNQPGTVTSCEARLIVGPLILTLQPADLLVSAGDEACFFVDGEGQQPFTYQWYKGEGDARTPIDVETNPTAALFEFVIFSATFDDEGFYSVDVSNEFGTVASRAVFLDIEPIIFSPPGDGEPQPTTTTLGGIAEFIAAVDGEEPVIYEWSFRPLAGTEYTVIEGQTSFRLEIADAQLSDVGFYRVKATNEFGDITSRDAKLTVQPPAGTSVIFAENFDSLLLGASIDEGIAADDVWTDTPPSGWTVDDSGVPGFDSEDADGDGIPDLDGVTEWAGWAFADREWWSSTAGDQQRSSFSKGMNVVAVADPDEWDDDNHTPFAQGDGYDALMSTPPISLEDVAAGSAVLAFDSSWRPEADNDVPGGNNQTGVIRVSFDGGDPIEVLRWESDSSSPNFKPDQEFIDESLTVALLNPDGAQNVVITFGLLDAGNDWWWALDNLEVTANVQGAGIPGLIGYWSFDDQTATDGSANGNDGTINGGAAFVPGQSGEAGDFALSFDGVDDSVTTGAPILSGRNAFTISGWVKFDAAQADRTGLFGQNDSVEFGMINATTLQQWLPQVPGLDYGFESAPEWTHLAVANDINGRTLYVNGEAVMTADPAPTGESAFGFNIGGGGIFDDAGNFFNGEIDDVAVYDVSLAAPQIKGLADRFLLPGGPVNGETPGGGAGAIELGSLTFGADGSVMISMPAGQSYDIEYSTDLISWEPVASDVSGSYQDSDAARASNPAGYYRGVQ